MRIILLFMLLPMSIAVTAQVELRGTVETVPEGTFLLIQADTRDTVAAGRIRNTKFSADIPLPDMPYAVPAMIMMVSEDRTMSQAAPLALSTGLVELSIDREGVVTYAGSSLQDNFNDFLQGARSLVTELEDDQDNSDRDSLSNLVGLRFDEYYEMYRNTGLAWFNALWIADLIDRKFLDPAGLVLLKRRCDAPVPERLDSIACAAIARYQEDWTMKPMPAIKARTAAGENVSIEMAEIDGPTVVDFWASWCGPCLREFPRLKEIYAAGGVRIIAVSIDSRHQDWERSLAKLDLPWLNLWDADGSAARAFQVTAVPAKFVIDSDGRVVSRNPEDIEAVLSSLKGK